MEKSDKQLRIKLQKLKKHVSLFKDLSEKHVNIVTEFKTKFKRT